MSVEKAHLVDSDNCQGERQRYWRSWGTASDRSSICGVGNTAEEAEKNAAEALRKREEFLASPLRQQLAALVSKEYMCPGEVEDAVKILARLVLEG